MEVYRYLGVLDEITDLAIPSLLVQLYAPPNGVIPVKEFYLAKQQDPTPSYPYVSMLFARWFVDLFHSICSSRVFWLVKIS